MKYEIPQSPSFPISRRQADTPVRAILLKDAAKDDTLINPRLLESILRNIAHAANRLLQHTKVELALATDVVLEHIRNSLERVVSAGEKDLRRPISIISTTPHIRKVPEDTYSFSKSNVNAKL